MIPLETLLADHAQVALALGGLLIGCLYGLIAERTSFCTMGALSDLTMFGDGRRLRSWMVAVATAALALQALAALGITDVSRSMYVAPRLDWAGHLVGGAMFGFGMALAGGCTSRNLVRAGTGDLRSALSLLAVALFASMANGGLLAPLRSELSTATAIPLEAPSQRLADVVRVGVPLSKEVVDWVVTVAVAGALATFAFASAPFRSSPMHWRAGLGIGLLVAAGWALTGLAFDDMADRVQPPASLTFVKPTADAIVFLERWTGGSGLPGFGVASVFGVTLGAFASARMRGRLRLQTFADTDDTLRHLGGAALMGVGGVMALGCSVGQGITGASTLALGSLIAVAAITAGTVAGLKGLERWWT